MIDSAMARAKEMVGRLWEISTELTHDGRVVGLRTARLNDVLVVMRPAGEPVYARVMELSESSRTSTPSLHPTVTVIFSTDKERIEAVTLRTYKEVMQVQHDLTEAKVAALGLRWEEGRFWTESERATDAGALDEDFGPAPTLVTESEVVAAAEAAAAELELENEAAWARVALTQAARMASEAADDAAEAVSIAAELEEAASAAAVMAVGGDGNSRAVLDAADREASKAAMEATEALNEAQSRDDEREAALRAATRAAALVSPGPMVTPAVTRSKMRLSEALEKRASVEKASAAAAAATAEASRAAAAAAMRLASKERAEAAAAAAAAEASTAAAAAAEKAAQDARGEKGHGQREAACVAMAKKMGLRLMRGGVRKLLELGYGADEVEALAAAGEHHFEDVLEDARKGGVAFIAMERAALKSYMVPATEAAPVAKARRGSKGGEDKAEERAAARGRIVEIAEVDSVESEWEESDELEEAAPASTRKVLFKAPVEVGRGKPDSRVKELVAMLSKEEAAHFVAFGLSGITGALLDRKPREAEMRMPRAALELMLEGHLGLSVEACREAAMSSIDELSMWLMRIINAKETALPSKSGGGSGGGAGVDATMAAIIAAGGSSSQSDPAVMQALREAAKDPSLAMELEEVRALFQSGKALEARTKMAVLSSRPCVAAIYYKSGDIKHTSGSAAIQGANDIVLALAAVRESVESDVARAVQGLLPPGGDARIFATRVTRGKYDEINLEQIFGSGHGASVMSQAVKAEKRKGGVDATDDPTLLLMRGFALMLVAVPIAHPFDVGATEQWARLLSEIARAIQDGLSLVEAVGAILDPVIQELSSRWRDVARGATPTRPAMKEVVAAMADKSVMHLRQRLEMRLRGERGGGGDGGKDEAGKGKKAAESQEGRLKKAVQQAEQAVKVAKEAKVAAAARTPGFGRGGGSGPPTAPPTPSPAVAWLQSSEDNANKCFYFAEKGHCKKGEKCMFFAGTEGHNK